MIPNNVCRHYHLWLFLSFLDSNLKNFKMVYCKWSSELLLNNNHKYCKYDILVPVSNVYVCVFFFPSLSNFSYTSLVSYNSTQFWYFLLEYSIISHRLRAQSWKAALYFRCQSLSLLVNCASNPLDVHQTFSGPPLSVQIMC